MDKIDFSTNYRAIQDAYNKVVRGDPAIKFVVYSVEKGVLVVSVTGAGDLADFVTNFDDGLVQFGLARVPVAGSDVTKILLLGWCPDNAPAKGRLSFAANFANVSSVLTGYHVQVTARDVEDLDVNDLVLRISAAAGASYSIQALASKNQPPQTFRPSSSAKSAPKPHSSKPASFVPQYTVKHIVQSAPDDGWNGQVELEERDFDVEPLSDLPSAYKPTKVDIVELRKQKSNTISSKSLQKSSSISEQSSPLESKSKSELSESVSSIEKRMATVSNDGRLTSMPKPKVSNRVSGRFNINSEASTARTAVFGSKPVIPPKSNSASPSKVVGGLLRNFGSENGMTPAQVWAEKRGQYKTVYGHQDAESTVSKEESDSIEDKIEGFSELEIKDPLSLAPRVEKKLFDNMQFHTQPGVVRNTQEMKDEKIQEEEKESKVKNSVPEPVDLSFSSMPPPRTRQGVLAQQKPEAAHAPLLPARNLPPPPTREPVVVSAPKLISASGHVAIAEYDYEKDEDNEIAFEEGDRIVDIEFVDDEWWQGTNQKTGEAGLFPAAYVVLQASHEAFSAVSPIEHVEPPKNTRVPPTPSATAMYDYEKDEDNEVSFAEGDRLVNIEFVDEEWWQGTNEKTSESGLFPANYVSLNQ